MSIKNCPNQERLLGYSLGTLPPEDARQIEEHVHACPECEGTLNLADGHNDTVLSELRKGPPPEIPIVEYPDAKKAQGDGEPAPAFVPKSEWTCCRCSTACQARSGQSGSIPKVGRPPSIKSCWAEP